MPCFHQMAALPQPGKTRNGKTPYKFIGKASTVLMSTTFRKSADVSRVRLMPCRQCIGCRLERSRQWATRLLLEEKAHDNACFLTLTYDDDHLPKNGSLNPSHLTTFFKDLRSRMAYHGKQKIKYFACGEYGDQTGRPHYHAIVYGPFGVYGSDDLRNSEEPSRGGDPQFSHEDLSAVWPHGLHRFSEFNFETAAYVARYVLKKITGTASSDHYGDLVPEFQRGSNGLGKGHVDRWITDIYPGDHVVLPGRGAFIPPPYFDRLLEKVDPSLYAQVKKARQEAQEPIVNRSELLDHYIERHREGEVRQLVTDATLIRGVL